MEYQENEHKGAVSFKGHATRPARVTRTYSIAVRSYLGGLPRSALTDGGLITEVERLSSTSIATS